jgi:formylmethanofuran dehydrogenase subunit D
MSSIQVILLTGRSLNQGRTKEHGKLSDQYLQTVACCEITSEDLAKINMTHGENIRIVTEYGSVIVKSIPPTQILPQGIVFMPYSLWATQIAGSDTDGSGMPSYKGTMATIQSAGDEKVLGIDELIKKSFSKVKTPTLSASKR